jgi:hypothetical protein
MLDNSFIFPYSKDKKIKQYEIWTNLQKGILFEDNQVFIPWLTPFSDLDKFAEQKKDNADRTNCFLGQHRILDDYECYVSNMKWSWTDNSKPFSGIDEFLGFDESGNKKFNLLKNKFIDLFGQPTINHPDKFYNFDIGTIGWTIGKIEISICGFEQFACKY